MPKENAASHNENLAENIAQNNAENNAKREDQIFTEKLTLYKG